MYSFHSHSNPDIHDIHVCSFISSQVIKDFVATNHITCLCKLIYRYIFFQIQSRIKALWLGMLIQSLVVIMALFSLKHTKLL